MKYKKLLRKELRRHKNYDVFLEFFLLDGITLKIHVWVGTKIKGYVYR